MLGTDFKAGQTKFKTAAVEYIRSLGMCPKVSGGVCQEGQQKEKTTEYEYDCLCAGFGVLRTGLSPLVVEK